MLRTRFTFAGALAVALAAAAFSLLSVSAISAAAQAPAPGTATRALGTIKSINGTALVLTPDSGSPINVNVADGARLLRIEPGQTDLKNAVPMELKDLQVGDRILVRGMPSADGSFSATAIIAMKRGDIQAKQREEQEQWQRGVGGLVSAVDPANGNLTVSVVTPAGAKPVTVHVGQTTIVRRYAPSSINFQDAKPSAIDQIKPGDQLRARGTKSEDGASFQADEIVSGSFRNIAGTISSVDASANTINVMDLATKKPVVVKLAADSQLRNLPQPMAQRLAMQIKGASGQNEGGAGGNQQSGEAGEASAGAGQNGREGLPAGRRAAADFQQMLARLPQTNVADLQKGQAVMIVASQGPDASVTAITLVSGVEPILQASPKGNQTVLLSPWNVGGRRARWRCGVIYLSNPICGEGWA